MRESFVVSIVLGLVGCGADGGSPPPKPTPSRVDAIATAGPDDRMLDGFCEVRHRGADAPAFTFPTLDGPAPTLSGWSWVNVWATWCGPCIEEMPRLVRFAGKLQADVGPGAVHLLSADAGRDVIDTFRGKHPATPPSARLAEEAAAAPFFASYGLSSPALPVHFLLDADQRVRCIRVGAVDDADYAIVKRVLKGG